MTVAEAVALFKQYKPLYDEAKAKLEAAKDVLVPFFENTDKREYKGILFSITFPNRLDTRAFRLEHPELAAEFSKPVPTRSLSLKPKGA